MRNRVLSAYLITSLMCFPAHTSFAGEGGWLLRGPVQKAAKLIPTEVPVYQLSSPELVGEPVAPPSSTGLRGSIESALLQDAEWHASLIEIKASEFEMRREAYRYLPTLTASYVQNDDAYRAASFSERERSAYVSLSASLPLYTGGSIYYGYKSAEARRDESIFNSLAVRDRRALRLLEVWTQAIVSQRELSLSNASVRRLNQLREAIAAQVSVGFASPSDLAQVDADLASARRSISTITADLAKARAELHRSGASAPGPKTRFANFNAYLSGGKQALIQNAYTSNPSLQGAAAAYRAETYAARAALGRHLPQVSLTGEYREYTNTQGISSTTNTDDRIRVGLEVSVPLVDLSMVSDTRAQAAKRDVALHREATALHGVKLEIDQLWEDQHAARKMRADAREEVAARLKNAEAARQRYEKGFGLLDEAIRAENSLLDAERQALEMQARESLLAAQLLLVSGRFDISMLNR